MPIPGHIASKCWKLDLNSSRPDSRLHAITLTYLVASTGLNNAYNKKGFRRLKESRLTGEEECDLCRFSSPQSLPSTPFLLSFFSIFFLIHHWNFTLKVISAKDCIKDVPRGIAQQCRKDSTRLGIRKS